jgi:hypothetical protein
MLDVGSPDRFTFVEGAKMKLPSVASRVPVSVRVRAAAALAFGFAAAFPIRGLAATHVVRPDGSGDFATIQQAVNAAAAGDVIELGSGTFTGPGNRDIQVPNRQLTIRSQAGDPGACVIDCEDAARGFHVVPSTEGTVLQGLTVTRGRSSHWGGALETAHSYAGITVVDCVFLRNSAADGGAVADNQSTFRRCRFLENSAYWGGAVAAFATAPNQITSRFEDCEFSDNSASSAAAAVALEVCALGARADRDPSFANCLFARNSAPGGGIVGLLGVSPTFEYCTFANNANSAGAIIDCHFAGYWPANPVISNTVIAFSAAGSPVVCDSQSDPTLLCCDLFGNAGGDWVGCVAGQAGSNGNFSQDPIFCDAANGDYTVAAGSPCAPGNNPYCGRVGALPVGCSGPVPAEIVRWGGLKWKYR